MEKDIINMLNEVEEIVDSGTRIPLTGKVLVDDALIFELLDRIRLALPEEITNAKWVLKERQRILDDAEAEGRKLVEEGKSYVEKMAEEDEVVKQAQILSEEIARQAQAYAREVKLGAIQYADDLCAQVEGSIRETLQALQQNREELKNISWEEGGGLENT